MGFKNAIRAGLWLVPLTAVLVVLPFLWRGTSNGHDLTFHVNSWLDVARQWHSGTLYPHWAVVANYGSGEPRFVFYPPVSWTAGALLGLALPWPAVPGALSVIACIGAGVSMYLFAREWMDDRTAVLAAVLYAVNPYQLMVIYERAAFGEMIAAVWLPGILLFALRERGGFVRNSLLLGVCLAAIWLTNLPAAVIASYLLAFVVIVRARQLRKAEPILRAAAAMALGLGLAAFYLVPAAYEQRWVQIGQAVGIGARPQDNFLFARNGDAEHDAVLLRTSIFALLEFIAVVIFAWWAKPLRQRSAAIYNLLLAMVILAIVLMIPLSIPLWNYAPKLMYVQFPWRWLLVLSVVLSIFAAVSFARSRIATLALFLLVPLLIGICYWRFQQKIYPEDRPAALAEAVASGDGYEGTDEYTPTQADNSNFHPFMPRIAIQIASVNDEQRKVAPSSFAHSNSTVWEPEHKRLTIDSQLPTHDTIRLLYYPAWKVTVDGKPFEPTADDTDGRMVLDLPEGHHEIAIDYTRTPDRTWGTILSAVALLAAIAMWIAARFSMPEVRP
jgi:hypothetical protein